MNRGRRWAIITAAAGTVFIAAGAFWLSFTALADLAARSGVGAGQAWAWPLIVDGIIVVATVAVVALAGDRAAWYPWALLIGGALVSVTANALHAVVAADASVPGLLAAAVAAVPPVVLLAITHLTVILTRHAPDTGADVPMPPGQAVPEPAVAETTPPGPRAIEAEVPDVHTPEPTRMPLAGHSAQMPAGERTTRREQAVRLRSEGLSNKQIARRFGVHPSTVGRWFAHLPDDRDQSISESEGVSS